MSESTDYILVGRVIKPHGLRGEVLVRSLSENPLRFAAGSDLLLGPDAEAAQPVTVEGSRDHKGGLLVFFEGYYSADEAEGLRNWLVFVKSDELGDLEEDDAYWEHQVVGLEVFHRDGRRLGRVSEIFSRPAQDLWSIDTGSGEVLFPAAKELVVSVELDAGRVVIDPPDGLFEA